MLEVPYIPAYPTETSSYQPINVLTEEQILSLRWEKISTKNHLYRIGKYPDRWELDGLNHRDHLPEEKMPWKIAGPKGIGHVFIGRIPDIETLQLVMKLIGMEETQKS
jgi:hypothetical protein